MTSGEMFVIVFSIPIAVYGLSGGYKLHHWVLGVCNALLWHPTCGIPQAGPALPSSFPECWSQEAQLFYITPGTRFSWRRLLSSLEQVLKTQGLMPTRQECQWFALRMWNLRWSSPWPSCTVVLVPSAGHIWKHRRPVVSIGWDF